MNPTYNYPYAELRHKNKIEERIKEVNSKGIDINQSKLADLCKCSRQLVSMWALNQGQPTKKYKKILFNHFQSLLPEMYFQDLFYTEVIVIDPKL